jgi:hypothetical protein
VWCHICVLLKSLPGDKSISNSVEAAPEDYPFSLISFPGFLKRDGGDGVWKQQPSEGE